MLLTLFVDDHFEAKVESWFDRDGVSIYLRDSVWREDLGSLS